MIAKWIKPLFLFAGAYDLIIGAVFLFFGASLFESANVPEPNHWGYIQFGAAMLIIFGLMFLAIAMDPRRNRNLIPFGMMLKVAYCAVAGYYWLDTGIPMLFKPFLIIDALMLIAFAVAYFQIPNGNEK